MKIFITGFLQVFFVAINTYLISKKMLLGVFICAFIISFIWSYNVKSISISGFKNNLLYSLGAAFGSLIGLIICIKMLKI
jgi:uncharacterized membrane protein (UPF0182 family)